MTEGFFGEQTQQSQVKSAIVSKYFEQWAKVITGYLKGQRKNTTIAYIDLFAGPGRYEDGAKSTPLLILETAVRNSLLRDNLVTLFNDKDASNTSSLVAEIKKMPGLDTLRYQPEVGTEEVGERIVQMFEQMKLVPTLFFVDPWGYKGLSLRLINSVLKNWACECIFFFNYNRINMGLANTDVKEHMDALFGETRGDALRVKLEPLSPDERELAIVEEICEALIEMGGKYTLPFGFKNSRGTRTKHHLIFVSKNSLGYRIMKGVMATESSTADQGVPSFEYSPASEKQPLLFELTRPLEALEDMLLVEFAGKTLTKGDLYERHNYGRRYIDKNYRDVLTKLELAGMITADPPHAKRKKNKGEVSFADRVVVTFPNRK